MYYARRLLTFAILTPLMTLMAFCAVRYYQAPNLYPGDRIETRPCLDCGGSGKDTGQLHLYPELGDRCPICQGTGKVELILPGPQRPTLIKGVVVDQAQTSPTSEYAQFRPALTRAQIPTFESPAGILAGVKLTFRDKEGATTLEEESNSSGLFTVQLAPGMWRVTATLANYQTTEQEFQVPVLTEPIWLEKAIVLREPRSFAEAQSLYGLGMLVPLAKIGAEQGKVIVSEGVP